MLSRTIAHEVAHGLFTLRHTFSEENTYILPQGTTDNLMDYSGQEATALYKYQWDLIHNPKRVWFAWLKDEEEVKASMIAEEDLLIKTLQNIGINACAYCQRCDYKPIQGNEITKLLVLAGKKYLCAFGHLNQDNTITSWNRLVSEQSTIDKTEFDKTILQVNSDQFIILIKNPTENPIICQVDNPFANYCNKADPFQDKAFTEKVVSDINKCATEKDYSGYKTSFSFNRLEQSTFDQIKASIEEKLQNDLFVNVKLCVELTSAKGKKETLLTKGLQNSADTDIRLRVHVNNQDSKVFFDIDVSEDYLQEYVPKWQQKASSKGYEDIDIESLRQAVINDLKSREVQGWFSVMSQSVGSLLSQKIGGFVEVLQTSQKIARNVWEEGKLPEGTWHSNKPETGYNDYPAYARFEPAISGACDAIIDEIMGIPLIIRTGYQLMTDKQQREAFLQIFTKEGFNTLKNALKDEVKQTFTDNQLLVYNSTKITTTVAFSLVTGGGNLLVKSGKKLDEIFGILDGLAEKFKNCPKLTKYLAQLQESGQNISKKIARLSKHVDNLGAEQVEKLAKQVDDIEIAIKNLDDLINKFDADIIANAIKNIPDEEIGDIIRQLSKFKDCGGVEDIIKDLGVSQKKAIGAKFVLKYADQFDPSEVQFEVKELIDNAGKITSRRYDAVINGVRHEFKSWREWYSWSDDVIIEQLVKDLANPEIKSLENLQWVFRRSEGITDEILKANVMKALKSDKGKKMLKEAFSNKEGQFKKLFGDKVKSADDIINLIDKPEIFNQIFKVF